ncbi:MAG TPA: hypothetical protein VNX01_11795 [Bacteroidia bacterium]|jgi:hypothetical protein|nr:hypothetical protein [Bacteroidia bacterium]
MKTQINITENQNVLMNQTINNLNQNNMKKSRTIESFEQFLVNVHACTNNGKFLSKENYKSYVRKVAKIFNKTEKDFLNTELIQLKAWKIQIEDKPTFKSLSAEYRSDLKSGFEAFVNYARYQAGFLKY